MHGACHQVCLARKSLNTKRLGPYSPTKSLSESFRGWDWLFRFWDAPLQHRHAIKVRCGFWKTIIADSLKQIRLELGMRFSD